MLYTTADILKANDEVIRVMALYEDTVHKPDVDSLLIDSTQEDARRGLSFMFLLLKSYSKYNIDRDKSIEKRHKTECRTRHTCHNTH